MCHNEIEIFVFAAHIFRNFSGNSLMVQRMEPAEFFQIRNTSDSCFGNHFIYGNRINNKGWYTDFITDISCNDCAKVRSVFAIDGIFQIFYHSVIYAISAARNGFHQAASANNTVELIQRKAFFFQHIYDHVLTVFIFIKYMGKLFQIFTRMCNVLFQNLFLIFIDSNFC